MKYAMGLKNVHDIFAMGDERKPWRGCRRGRAAS